jgi:hypothetical protein
MADETLDLLQGKFAGLTGQNRIFILGYTEGLRHAQKGPEAAPGLQAETPPPKNAVDGSVR